MNDHIANYQSSEFRAYQGLVIKTFLGVALAMGLGGAAFANEQCYERNYTNAHLARHPHQTVTSFTLRVGESETDRFSAWITMRGSTNSLHTAGNCSSETVLGKLLLRCREVCDGGRFDIEERRDGSVLVYLVKPLGFSMGTGCVDHVDVLGPGIDDDVFKLYRAPRSFCMHLEAQMEGQATE